MKKNVEMYSEPSSPTGAVAELFAGVGGFRIGLAAAGWKTVFSNQWEPSTKQQHASEVYAARFGSEGHSNADIATVSAIPTPFDLLVGGFPCQDYSVAKSLSSSTGLSGKKGVLWWEILRLVTLHQPKQIFLENVDRLLKSPSSQRGRDFAVMLSTLGNAGYSVEWRVVNSADYGFPQRRIRVFIVAQRKSSGAFRADALDRISKTGVLARALPVSAVEDAATEIPISDNPEYVSLEFNRGPAKSPFGNSGYFENGVATTTRTTASYVGPKSVLGDVIVGDGDVPKEYWIDANAIPAWEYLKGAKSIDRTHKGSGFKYAYSEGKMAFPDSLEKPSRTILTGEGGSAPSRFKHVIRTESGFRRLLPLELERLCGFPDGWTAPDNSGLKITDGRRAFFMGNALVVGLVERVGRVLGEDLSAPSLSSRRKGTL